MKKILLLSLLVLAACRPASVVPGTGGGDSDISIAFLKTLYNGAPLHITGEYLIRGTVVSSDREGNFYKTLVVEDETGGIELKLDTEEIFKRFRLFSRVSIRCNGLWLGSYGGTLQLGAEPFGDFEIQPLSPTVTALHMTCDETFYEEILPNHIEFSELTIRYISTFVSFDRVRFIDEERGLGWAEIEVGNDPGSSNADPDPNSDPDPVPSATDRHLINAAGDTLLVRTSRYARFAGKTLPEGIGRIEGILGYFNGNYQLVVCDDQKFYGSLF